MVAGAMLGVNVRICTPKALSPKEAYVDIAKDRASKYGGSVLVTDKIDEAVKGADVIYTDVWVSMGEESEFEERINLLKDYQVNKAMFDLTGRTIPFSYIVYQHSMIHKLNMVKIYMRNMD